MWIKWLPWKSVIRRLAKDRGFGDPVKIFSQFQRFAQPSEVAVPLEILRLAAVLHARGLMNTQAIQHNLDWVWPYWIERQFDPADPAFIPRSFSLSHINLTHRNWTAVGIPGCAEMPVVDPAGMVTPFLDSWSLDFWIIPERGVPLIPSRMREGISQRLVTGGNLQVVTESRGQGLMLSVAAQVTGDSASPVLKVHVAAAANRKAWCVVSLRPCNPEGVSFVHRIEARGNHQGWLVNGKDAVSFTEPDKCMYSDYRNGDVYHFLPHSRHRRMIECETGLATAAALYPLDDNAREIEVSVPLKAPAAPVSLADGEAGAAERWRLALKSACLLKAPDARYQFLYDAAVRTLVLHSPGEVYPGPYTYKHFWFRDAAFILNAMLCLGLSDRAEQVIDRAFFPRLTRSGYFHSQDGEWDSNGQALWTLDRFCRLTGRKPDADWKVPVERAAAWIQKRRLSSSSGKLHAGLLPPGFSAEHLGPADYYYWDDFWGAAGLGAAASMLGALGEPALARRFDNASHDLLLCIDRSVRGAAERLGHEAVPASPYRRMDTGAIGSLAGGYPLELWGARDPRLLATTDYLMKYCLVNNGFFHEMSHSGLNPYLTLHLAQVLLRAGDSRFQDLMNAVADLASPTGQWPEAIHPKTLGGCMGDGQHVWAAAEWLMMVRNSFVREEGAKLVLFSGIPASWLEGDEEIAFGPAATAFGNIVLRLKPEEKSVRVFWMGQCFGAEPELEIRLPGFEPVGAALSRGKIEIEKAGVT